jgi:hypothetical protein
MPMPVNKTTRGLQMFTVTLAQTASPFPRGCEERQRGDVAPKDPDRSGTLFQVDELQMMHTINAHCSP